MVLSQPVHVIGATGRTGLALCRALAKRGRPFVPVIRNTAKWAATGMPEAPRVAGADDPVALQQALTGAECVISTAHASYAQAILAAAPFARVVLLGSTRVFSRYADEHGAGIRRGEQALLDSGRAGIMLHPTMIYGGPDDGTVQRLVAVLRRSRLLPLPGGGRSLVQPIHRCDVVRCVLAAMEHPLSGPQAMVIAGPTSVSYASFTRAVAVAARLPVPLVLPIPLTPLLALARLTAHLPGVPQAGQDEIRRLTEDKSFSIADMIDQLGVTPRSLATGLAQEFGAQQNQAYPAAQESTASCP